MLFSCFVFIGLVFILIFIGKYNLFFFFGRKLFFCIFKLLGLSGLILFFDLVLVYELGLVN